MGLATAFNGSDQKGFQEYKRCSQKADQVGFFRISKKEKLTDIGLGFPWIWINKNLLDGF